MEESVTKSIRNTPNYLSQEIGGVSLSQRNRAPFCCPCQLVRSLQGADFPEIWARSRSDLPNVARSTLILATVCSPSLFAHFSTAQLILDGASIQSVVRSWHNGYVVRVAVLKTGTNVNEIIHRSSSGQLDSIVQVVTANPPRHQKKCKLWIDAPIRPLLCSSQIGFLRLSKQREGRYSKLLNLGFAERVGKLKVLIYHPRGRRGKE